MKDVIVNFSSLDHLSSKLSSIADSFKRETENFNKISNEIYQINKWQGNDQNEYFKVLDTKYKVALQKISNSLYDYSTYLNDTSTIYNSLESRMGEEPIDIY